MALKAIGAWMETNSKAIHATKAGPLGPFDWGRCTQKNNQGNGEPD